MFDTLTRAHDLLEAPRDPDAHRSKIEELEHTEAFAREHASEGVKERADHGRVLGTLSEALGLVGRCDEAIALREEALVIWEDLGRARAAHLARIKLVGLYDRVGKAAHVDALIEALYKSQQAQPDTLAKPYALSLKHEHGRVLARRGECTEACAMWRTCLEMLGSTRVTPLHEQLDRLLTLTCTNEPKLPGPSHPNTP